MIDKEVNVIKKLSADYRLENFSWKINNLLIEKFKVDSYDNFDNILSVSF